MRREIASKLRRAASVLRTVMLWASLALWLAIAATALIVVLAVGLAAYFAFGWLGVGAVAVFVLIVFFGKDPPTEQTGPRRKGKGLNLNDDPNPWRSEEHTSELQSLMRISYAVFCLKKK